MRQPRHRWVYVETVQNIFICYVCRHCPLEKCVDADNGKIYFRKLRAKRWGPFKDSVPPCSRVKV